MKTIIELLIIAALLATFSGCATVGAGHVAQSAAPGPAGYDSPINESFFFKPRDRVACGNFAARDQAALFPAVMLEFSILHRMAAADTEAELAQVFDRLWIDEAMVRELIGNEARRLEYLQATALLHYLLAADPGAASWKREAAERIHQESLARLSPGQLSGYALHFHAFALLKTGRFDRFMEYAGQLRNATTAEVYLQDLAVALEYALAAEEAAMTGRLMAAICRTWSPGGGVFPDRVMEQAVTALQKNGRIEPVRWSLSGIIEQKPDLQSRSFARLLAGGGASGPGLDLSRSGAPEAPGRLLIKVQVILAGDSRMYIDPGLAEAGSEMLGQFSYSSLELIGEETFLLAPGEKAELPLPDGFMAMLQPERTAGDTARLTVRIRKGLREKLQVLVDSGDGGVTTVGGPRGAKGTTLLRITTYCSGAGPI